MIPKNGLQHARASLAMLDDWSVDSVANINSSNAHNRFLLSFELRLLPSQADLKPGRVAPASSRFLPSSVMTALRGFTITNLFMLTAHVSEF